MNANDVFRGAEWDRQRREDEKENSLFRHAIKAAVVAAAAHALFARRGA